MSVQSTKAAAMGFDGGLTTYLDTNKTLKDLGTFDPNTGDLTLQMADGKEITLKGTEVTGDAASGKNEKLYEYSLTINGETLKFDQNTSIGKIMDSINSSDAGVEVSFSKTTNQFNLTAKETGSAGRIEIAENDLAGALFFFF